MFRDVFRDIFRDIFRDTSYLQLCSGLRHSRLRSKRTVSSADQKWRAVTACGVHRPAHESATWQVT